ncbi:hypothetical protein KAR91_65440 [Candidatus Pacearchaeota archaeon]|nr:hypothetical protein [Candidatus Pacearchaeota archaeon]
MKMLIFAGSYTQYQHLMQDQDIPHLHREWLYVGDVQRVTCCLRNTPYILYGTWNERPDCAHFLKLAEGKNFIRVEPVNNT